MNYITYIKSIILVTSFLGTQSPIIAVKETVQQKNYSFVKRIDNFVKKNPWTSVAASSGITALFIAGAATVSPSGIYNFVNKHPWLSIGATVGITIATMKASQEIPKAYENLQWGAKVRQLSSNQGITANQFFEKPFTICPCHGNGNAKATTVVIT